MAEIGQGSSARRVGNLERVGVYVAMAILSMWQNHPRASVIMGMARASVRGKGPDGGDEELLEQLGP